MELKYPIYLFGILLTTIPILIHLFEWKKKKKVLFSNIAFLKSVQQQQNKHSKLKHLLILISRCLLIIFASLALSQPYIPSNQKSIQNNIIYIDNSPSMGMLVNGQSQLALAKNKVYEFIDEQPSGTKFTLITNDNTGALSPVNQSVFKEKLGQISIVPRSLSLEQLSQLIQVEFGKGTNNVLCFSDNDSIFNSYKTSEFDTNNVYYISNLDIPENVAIIDTAWFGLNTNQNLTDQKLFFKIKNLSEDSIFSNVNLLSEGKVIGNKQIQVGGKSFHIDSVFYSKSNTNGIYELVIDQPEAGPFAKLGLVTQEDKTIEYYVDSPNSQLLESTYSKEHIFNLNQSKDSADIILTESMKESDLIKYLQAGKTIIYDVSNDNISSLNELGIELNKASDTNIIKVCNPKSKWINNIIKPNSNMGSFKNYASNTRINKYPLKSNIWLCNQLNQPLLLEIPIENGILFLSTINLFEVNSFSQHILYLPIIYEMSFSNSSSNQPYYSLNKHSVIQLDNVASAEPIKIIQNTNQFIPKQNKKGRITNIYPDLNLTQNGLALLKQSNKTINSVCFNYDRNEISFNRFKPNSNFKTTDFNLKDNFNQFIQRDNDLWPIFIIISLLILAIEIILIRILK